MKLHNLALAAIVLVVATTSANANRFYRHEFFDGPCPWGQTRDFGTLECRPIYHTPQTRIKHLHHHRHHHWHYHY